LRFRPLGLNFGYECLKNVFTYFLIVATLALYRPWAMRLQGEARMLAAPDERPPVESIESLERFLVRKLGKEFLVNASASKWLQASGSYWNLRVHGRDYPLRTTMAVIEGRARCLTLYSCAPELCRQFRLSGRDRAAGFRRCPASVA
jgi:hypothetical protein